MNYGKKVKQSRYHHVNQDLYPLKSLMEGGAQNVLKKEKFSWLPLWAMPQIGLSILYPCSKAFQYS
jgi:hypothetical protein